MTFGQQANLSSTEIRRYALLVALIIFFAPALASGAPVYPVKKSANGRYLVDQNNVPFLMAAHDAQGLIGVLSHAEADFFFC